MADVLSVKDRRQSTTSPSHPYHHVRVKFVQAEDVHYLYEIAWNKPGASTSSADDDEDMETPCVWELEAMQIEDNESTSAVPR